MSTPTLETLRAKVNSEIPYVVGEGTTCLQKRTNRLKKLMRKHGIPIEPPRTNSNAGLARDYSKQHPTSDYRR